MKKRVLSLLLALLLVVSLLPFAASAADAGKVRVIVENTTLRQETYQGHQVPWKDLLFDVEVDYASNMSMDGALRAASAYLMNIVPVDPFLQYETSEQGSYLSGVGGLLDWGTGGWMATLNDWFCDIGMTDMKVQPGDTVRVMYTLNYGKDIDGDRASTDTGLKDLSFDHGALYPAFSHDVTDYTLYLPEGVDSVLIAPSAANKNNKVFVTAGDEDASRWGARTVSASAGTATVKVDGGMAYTVKLAAPPKTQISFVDVPEDAYYAAPVAWAVEQGVTDGVDETHFVPAADCTRGQIVTFLWRANHSQEPKSTVNPFSDVKTSDYFYKAVLWAVEQGITDGMDETHFAPNASCTRAHAVTFLWRSKDQPAAETTSSRFADVQDENAYYHTAVLWAVEQGITDGTSETTFSPDSTCTRAQIVTFLYRDRSDAAAESPLDAARSYMLGSVTAPVCGQSDWAVFDMARNAAAAELALPATYRNYYASVAAKAKETGGRMDAHYATDYARYVLAVTALGYNAADVAGFDLTERLSDVKYVTSQGTNGAIFALLALDSGGYVSYARPDLVQAVLDAQLSDGGWTYGADDPADPDLTAMALQALTPYIDEGKVSSAVNKGLLCLSDLQRPDGGFFSWGASSSESTAQALIAACALQTQTINPYTAGSVPGLFVKMDGTEENTLQSNLRAFQLDDGSFCHTKEDGTTNGYATEQCLRALVAEQCAELGVLLYGIR